VGSQQRPVDRKLDPKGRTSTDAAVECEGAAMSVDHDGASERKALTGSHAEGA
jgi:hypothetical protein